MNNNSFTPQEVSKNNTLFSIPLYQRLFEWEKPQIEQLLHDLKSNFELKAHEPYYIGMLTVYTNQKQELVDGQQRFTVMMLLGIAFQNENWKKFLWVNNEPRLSFFARKKDEEYLKAKIKGEETSPTNKKMENGILIIQNFLATEFKDEQQKLVDFQNYVFEKMTFFISKLPEKYQSTDLNRYFEAMNATGRGLENHEILKVNLLKKLLADKVLYTKIWNMVSDMDKSVIRQSTKEDIKPLERQKKILSLLSDTPALFASLKQPILNKSNPNSDGETSMKIGEIGLTSNTPEQKFRASGERSIISFSEFLLLVLELQLKNKVSTDVNKLQETFKNQLNDSEIQKFFDNLLKYRVLFDYFIIKVSNNDQNNISYLLNIEKEASETKIQDLIQYQSMLYVSTSFTLWLPDILLELEKNPFISIEELLKIFKAKDDSRRPLPPLEDLQYGKDIRYWFWRLDYYLWENRKTENYENKSISKAVENYIFRPNRSIEHLHPQNPQNPEKFSPEWVNYLHTFGNLAMISTSFNSTQSNDDEKVKFARVYNQIEGKYTLESIKLLQMYLDAQKDNWTIEKAQKHGEQMYEILKASFNTESI